MRGVIRVAVVPAVLLLASGCATRDWVRDLVGQREAQIDQRVGKVDARVGDESQRVTQLDGRLGETSHRLGEASHRLGGVETTVGEVGQSAQHARARAEAAHTRADEVDGRLSRLWGNRHARQLVETIHVQFAFDRANLTDGAQSALLTIVKELRANPGLSVDLEGYTDAAGTREYNLALSQRRVEAVRRYLIEQGLEMPRVYSVGLGPLNATKSPDDQAKQRRVTVRLMVATD